MDSKIAGTSQTYPLELFQRPLMRLTRPMAWEVCRGNVGYGLCIDANELQRS